MLELFPSSTAGRFAKLIPDYVEFIIGLAHRVRLDRWLHPDYGCHILEIDFCVGLFATSGSDAIVFVLVVPGGEYT